MSVNVLYKTSAKATGGRDGHAATLDGALDVKLTTPKELGGGGGAGNNPEQLFAAGYAACFIGAMKFVASQGGPKVPADASVTSTVGIGPRSAGGFGLDIDLAVSLPGLAQRGRGGPGREGAPGVPLFQRDPRQCRCAPDGRVGPHSEWPAAITGGPFALRGIFRDAMAAASCAPCARRHCRRARRPLAQDLHSHPERRLFP